MGLTTRLQFSYEQTACECSKTRKILQTNGQKYPTKTSRAHNRVKGYFARLVEGEVFDGRPRNRGKEEVVIDTWIMLVVKRP
jgi:hypothetical protein